MKNWERAFILAGFLLLGGGLFVHDRIDAVKCAPKMQAAGCCCSCEKCECCKGCCATK